MMKFIRHTGSTDSIVTGLTDRYKYNKTDRSTMKTKKKEKICKFVFLIRFAPTTNHQHYIISVIRLLALQYNLTCMQCTEYN